MTDGSKPPWESGGAIDFVSRALRHFHASRSPATTAARRGARAHRASTWIARALVFFLLEKFFPERVPSTAAELGTLELRVLEVMTGDPEPWSANVQKQTAAHLAAHGLPATQAELDAWLKARVD